MPLLLVLLAGGLHAATADQPAGEAGQAAAILAALDAANRARASLTQEQQAWALERLRLEGVRQALQQEQARLTHDLATATAQREAAQTQARQLAAGGDLAALRATAAQAAAALSRTLVRDAHTALPGAVVVPEHPESATLPEIIRALDQSERAASVAAVDLVSGRLAGETTAVTLLRVGGQRGWWLSLDQTRAGTARMRDGILQLTPTEDPAARAAIAAAIAIVQGRRPAQFVVLPADPPVARTDGPTAPGHAP